MKAANVNVVMDVKQSLNAKQYNTLAGVLGDISGVIRTDLSARTSRLVLVDYNPAQVSAKHILGSVVRHGYDARLIGM